MSFPVTVIDDFFDYPEQVAEFAKTVDYFPNGGGYPGMRSKRLSEIAPVIQSLVIKKLFSTWYTVDESFEVSIDTRFQIMPRNEGFGWVHQDTSIMSCIIYLDKDAPLGRGTSIYRPKYCMTEYADTNQIMEQAFNSSNYTSQEYLSARKKLEDKFEETICVENVFNRLVAFPGHYMHRSNGFDNVDNEFDRHTIISFVYDIRCTVANTPEQRFRSSMAL